MSEAINPDYDPTGMEGGVDTNVLPWMAVPGTQGVHLKPLRASTESGMFSVVVKLEAGAGLPSSICLGGMDLFVLSGEVLYEEDGVQSTLEPGTWGYIPANTRITSMLGQGDAELLANFYSALAFLAQRMVESRPAAELLTVYRGAEVSDEEARETVERLTATLPDTLEVELVIGGQPHYPYQVSLE